MYSIKHFMFCDKIKDLWEKGTSILPLLGQLVLFLKRAAIKNVGVRCWKIRENSYIIDNCY